MSHSQFHSTKLFILRHAWLNLWDKHMTTGRINQVTTFPSLHPKGCNCLILVAKPCSQSGVHHLKVERSECDPVKLSALQLYWRLWANYQTALFPGLTNFKHISPCHKSNKDHGLQRELPMTDNTSKDVAQSWRIPKWLNATGLAISK
jgi:hypothetical protein